MVFLATHTHQNFIKPVGVGASTTLDKRLRRNNNITANRRDRRPRRSKTPTKRLLSMFAQSAVPTAKSRCSYRQNLFFSSRRFNNTAAHTHQNFIKPVGVGASTTLDKRLRSRQCRQPRVDNIFKIKKMPYRAFQFGISL